MIHGLALLLFLRPFVCSLTFPERSFPFGIVFFIYLLVWIGFKRIDLPKNNTTAAIAIFIGMLILSSLLSSSHLVAAINLSQYVCGILLFLICLTLPHEHADKIFSTLIATAVAISLAGLYQFLFGFQHTLDFLQAMKIDNFYLEQQIQQKRIYAVFITPNALGSYIAMLLPLALALPKKVWTIPLILALILTQSVGAFMSLLLIFPFYVYQRRLFNPSIFVIFAALIVTGAGFIFWRTQPHTVFYNLGHSIDMRFQYWQETWAIIKNNPLTGTGIGNFDLPSAHYAHNMILQLWAETGLTGLLAFVFLIFTIFRHGWASLVTAQNPDRSAALLFSAIIFLINNLIDFTFFLPEVALVWCVILGLACNRSARTASCATPAKNNSVQTRRS